MTDRQPTVDYETWLRQGIDNGFVGPPVCATHDGIPSTEDEDNQYMDGGDPCQFVIRLYDSQETRSAVEANHSPSVWRRTNMG